jgi:hypothetical protein
MSALPPGPPVVQGSKTSQEAPVQTESRPWWAEVIRQVTSPIHFFSLIVVVGQSFLAKYILDCNMSGDQKFWLMAGMMVTTILMIAIVTYFMRARPSALVQEVQAQVIEVRQVLASEGFDDVIRDIVIEVIMQRRDMNEVVDHLTGPGLEEQIEAIVRRVLAERETASVGTKQARTVLPDKTT